MLGSDDNKHDKFVDTHWDCILPHMRACCYACITHRHLLDFSTGIHQT
jgi:hypothetical protein